MNYMQGDNVVVCGNKVILDGKELPPCPSIGKNITTINRNVYIDGYEFKRGKWRKTIRALWHLWF